MSKIDTKEIMKMAALSSLSIEPNKMDALITQLESVLNYAARVIEIAADADELPIKRVNIMREDVVIPFDSVCLMQAAPERDHNYFVVPKIVDGAR